MKNSSKKSTKQAIKHLVGKRRLVGRSEWITLPELGISDLEAKIDTGAATSAIHCAEVTAFERDGTDWVRFSVVVGLDENHDIQECVAPVRDTRMVKHTGGVAELRYLIETSITMGEQTWPIELTLARRDNLKFRMIIGRQALQHKRLLVHPTRRNLRGLPRG